MDGTIDRAWVATTERSSRLDAIWLFNTGFGMFVAGLLGAGMGLRREIHRREHAL